MSALQGMRVLDISQFESGPSCAQWLAWYGAEVVRIDLADERRNAGFVREDALHLANNHNKKAIAIDLRRDEGLALFYRLLPRFDIVIENFAYGQAEKMKLDYPTLKRFNPGLIYCTIKGFGLTGPYRDYKALDPVAQAASGGMSVTGAPGGPPLRAGYLVGDNVSGISAATGVLAAYVQKLRTGEGQLIEVSMQEALLGMMRSTLLHKDEYPGGVIPRRGNRMTPPTDLYPCAPGGPSDYVMITWALDRMVTRLFELIGRPELASDPRFSTKENRIKFGDALWEEVAKWTRERTKWQVMEILGKGGVPASAVFDLNDVHQDPHLKARDALVTVHHAVRGDTTVVRNPVRLHGSPVQITAPPIHGEHTRDVLTGELGLDEDELDTLTARGILRQA
jgi:formyl-CoA transferase